MKLHATIVLLIGCLPICVIAENLPSLGKKDESTAQGAEAPRFTAYGVNYALFQNTQNDDASLEGHYSFRYTLFDCRRGNSISENIKRWDTCAPIGEDNLQFLMHFTMTGEFDFYLGSRDSGPVINRISNPALHLQWIWGQDKYWIDYIDVGIWEHRSDGQVTEIDEVDEFGRLLTQNAYESNDYQFFDGLSRGSNYLSINTGSTYLEEWTWKASLKVYYTKDTEVNWGPLANKDVDIADYDILNFAINKNVNLGWGEMPVVVNYTVGKKLFKTDSLDLSLGLPIKNDRLDIPFFVNMHIGPMDTLSNYTESIFSIGLGLYFSWY